MPWEWLLYVLLIVLHVVGLFLNILGVPGLWLMVVAHIGYAWATGWGVYTGWPSVIAIVLLAIAAEAVEFLAGAAGSKAAGGSKRGMAGAIAGGIVGGILGTGIPVPIVGTIVGAVAGAGLGAFLVERGIGKSQAESTQIAIGAAKGRFWGILGKSMFGVLMFLVSAIAAFPLGGNPAVAGPAGPAPGPATTGPTTSISLPSTTLPATLPTVTPETPVER